MIVPFMSHSCTIFEAYLINSLRFVSVKRCWLYQNSNITPRDSGHFFIFGFVFFVRKRLLGKARQWNSQKFAILSLKPRSHFRSLIYRALAGYSRYRAFLQASRPLTRIARTGLWTRLACTHSSFNHTQENSLKKAAWANRLTTTYTPAAGK